MATLVYTDKEQCLQSIFMKIKVGRHLFSPCESEDMISHYYTSKRNNLGHLDTWGLCLIHKLLCHQHCRPCTEVFIFIIRVFKQLAILLMFQHSFNKSNFDYKKTHEWREIHVLQFHLLYWLCGTCYSTIQLVVTRKKIVQSFQGSWSRGTYTFAHSHSCVEKFNYFQLII